MTAIKGYGAWQMHPCNCWRNAQGRGQQECHTPDACRLAEDPMDPARGAIVGIVLGVLVWLAIGAFALGLYLIFR